MMPRNEAPVLEIIPNRQYFYSGALPPTSNESAYFFSSDEELQYDSFNNDFGPPSLAQLHKSAREIVRLLVDPEYKDVKTYHYCCHGTGPKVKRSLLDGLLHDDCAQNEG